jgi:hypothetical protein
MDGAWRKTLRADKIKEIGELRESLIVRLSRYIEGDERFRHHYHHGSSSSFARSKATQLIGFFINEARTKHGLEAVDENLMAYLWERIHSLWFFELPATHLLAVHTHCAEGNNSAKTFAYRLDAVSPVEALKSCHALDLPYMFGTYRLKQLGSFFTGLGPDVAKLSLEMITSWTSFAKTGDPGWAPFQLDKSKRNFRIFNIPSSQTVTAVLNDKFLGAIDGFCENIHLPVGYVSHLFSSSNTQQAQDNTDDNNISSKSRMKFSSKM